MARVDISVVTVTRDNRPGLESTHESVRKQEDVGYEHIVVDGSSGDDTSAWLRKKSEIGALKYVSEPDDGIYDGMNKGIQMADGELLVFLNAGDVFPRKATALEVMSSFRRHTWDWAYGVTVLVDPLKRVSRIHDFAPFSRLRLGLGLSAVPHQAAWFTRDLVAAIGGYSLSAGLSADMDFCWQAAKKAPPYLIADVLAVADEGGVSAMQSSSYYPRAMRRNNLRRGDQLVGPRVADEALYAIAIGASATAGGLGRLLQRFANE